MLLCSSHMYLLIGSKCVKVYVYVFSCRQRLDILDTQGLRSIIPCPIRTLPHTLRAHK